MANYYLILRAVPFLLAARSLMLNVDDWLSVAMAPECWDLAGVVPTFPCWEYSPEELGLLSADPSLNEPTRPAAQQSLRYAASGAAGVHLLFIALAMLYLGVTATVESGDIRAPASMLVLDALTFANAAGSFHLQAPVGHLHCFEVPTSLGSLVDCGKGLGSFAAIAALDMLVFVLVLAGIYPRPTKGKEKGQ